MLEIKIDGYKMASKKLAHIYIKDRLKSVEHHGENLDALWDVLSTYDKNVKIKMTNKDKLIESLGHYGEDIIKVFIDAEQENDNINFEIIK